MYTRHIKAPVLKEILLEDKTCEEKLNRLKDLVGIPSEVPVPENNLQNTDERALSKEKILADLTASSRKLANELLDYIQASDFISWNPQTFELVLDGKDIEYSNIENLIKKVVQTLSPNQPIAFVLFIDALLKLKVPQNLFRDGDAVNTRAQLLTIKNSLSEAETVSAPEEVSKRLATPVEGIVDDTEPNNSNTVETRKRTRDNIESEDEGEEFIQCGKRKKVELTDANQPVETRKRTRDNIESEDEGEQFIQRGKRKKVELTDANQPNISKKKRNLRAIVKAGWEAYNA